MRLSSAIEAYIALKRAMGAAFNAESRVLRSFGRSIGDVPVATVSFGQVQSFWRGDGPLTIFSSRKYYTLRGFFRYLLARGHLSASPLAASAPKVRSSFQCYVYSPSEIRRLLDAIHTEISDRTPLQSQTVRAVLLLLYETGLRAGEALRLRCSDVDLRDRVLTVWNTKFFKSRLVPFGKTLSTVLASYEKERRRWSLLQGTGSPFFSTREGKEIRLGALERVFVRLRERAAVNRPPTDRWQPRLHDLRATFAVRRLIAWYREGVDLRAHLPLLATYLGHVNISGTQRYLTMTTELLAEASFRFERYACPEKGDWS